jgi:hypothetical protein
MVNGIMKVSELDLIGQKLNLIQKESLHQFAADVNGWYEQAFFAETYMKESEMPPNLFRLFAYFSYKGDMVLHHFGERKNTMEAQKDVAAILNGYHLFYCHQDDAYPLTRYYNHFSKEVW